jgi:hypothetical protein
MSPEAAQVPPLPVLVGYLALQARSGLDNIRSSLRSERLDDQSFETSSHQAISQCDAETVE